MKKITIENKVDKLVVIVEKLAEKIDCGFAMMEEKFDGVGQEFEKVYERFDQVDQRFNKLELSINRRFFESNDQLHGLQDKMARVENILKIG